MPLLTLAAARSMLWQYGSVVDPVAATTADKLAVSNVINQVCERFLTNQKVRGSFTNRTLPIYDSYVTLPANLQTILQANLIDTDGNPSTPFTIKNRWFLSQAYLSGGLGSCGADWNNMRQNGSPSIGMYDVGEGFVGYRVLSGTFKVRVTVSQTEPGTATILFRGVGATGLTVFTGTVEGNSVTIPASASADSSADFTRLDFWVKSGPTNGPITLSAVDNTSGVVTPFAYIFPGETASNYRRYFVPSANAANTDTISALCKHAYVPAVADNDPVIPSHVGALKLGMMALQAEDKWDTERAGRLMGAALQLLDDDRAEFDGDSAQGRLNVVGDFGGGTVCPVM